MTGFNTKRAINNVNAFPPTQINYRLKDKAVVDGEQWYTVMCNRETRVWLTSTFSDSKNKLWHEHIDNSWMVYANVFDIHEKIYTMLVLRGL